MPSWTRACLLAMTSAGLTAQLGWSTEARAQQDTTSGGGPGFAAPASSVDAVTPPVLRSRVDATYPPEALRDRVSASVGLEVVVDESGHIATARVTTPAGHGFDQAALDAVRRFTFEPARRNGAPVRSTVQLSYEFHPPPPRPTPGAAPPPAALQQGSDQSTLVVAERPRVPIGAPPERNAASDSTTDQREMSLRPRFRAEGMLEVVPGLFSVQHAGGGKAQQDFARGFNLDHGTDMAFFVDDVPVNAVSHAHGQGYSDLHFLIPETVARIDSTKGTYAADKGDFATAGTTTFRMADHTTESVAKLEIAPSTQHDRLVVVESPDLGDRWRMVVATEAFHEDGPFIHPEDYDRFNGYAKVTRVLDERSELSLTAMAYGGTWNMSGVLPARAVCGEGDGTPTPSAYSGSRCLSRWDSVDPTQGGGAQRFMAAAEYRRQLDERWDLEGERLRAALEPAALPERRPVRPLPARRHPVRLADRAGRHPHADRHQRAPVLPRHARRHPDPHDAGAAGPRRRHRRAAAPHPGAPAPRRRGRQHPRAHLRRPHRRDGARRLRRGGVSPGSLAALRARERAAIASTSP